MTSQIQSLQAEAAMAAAIVPPTIPKGMDVEGARKVAQDFEAFFLSKVLGPMFTETKAEEPYGGGMAEEMWKSLQVDEYGKAMARAGGIGIADAVFKELLRTQEAQ